ncbi:Hypothetical predicted protein [Paramuricea clavata]|uniref:Uncharacterized protein n=2 Tax=Paramuricea clavata TaxID=317549 RepID=A0A6S7HXM2_PARCT|nr:Hypothetical predicted protein [Paramuricea clavata]
MKNFLVILLMLSTMTLCLAKPKWIWFDEEEKNDGNFNDEVLTREKGKNEENLLKEWKKAYDRSEEQAKPKPKCPIFHCG